LHWTLGVLSNTGGCFYLGYSTSTVGFDFTSSNIIAAVGPQQ